MKDTVWSSMWQLEVPQKLKHFIWRCCKNLLAVRVKLHCWRIRLDTSCPNYGKAEETQHLLFHCPFAHVFWFGCPIQLDSTLVQGKLFLKYGNGLRSGMNQSMIVKIIEVGDVWLIEAMEM